MRTAQIIAALRRLEAEEQITIVYACESGSRAWGFASSDSDYDVRFIYHRSARDYLELNPPRDVIERPLEDEIDLSGWDIFKACGLLRKSNPPLLEWLGSPIVYLELPEVTRVLRQESAEHFNLRSCGEHYLSMARSNLRSYIEKREEVSKKKYLYAIRPLLCARWLLTYRTFPPTLLDDVIKGLDVPQYLCSALHEIIAAKLNEPEQKLSPRVEPFDRFIESELGELMREYVTVEGGAFPPDKLNELLRGLLKV